MSIIPPGEPSIQGVIEAGRAPIKCRIPQRLPPGRVRLQNNSVSNSRTKSSNYSEPSTKSKYEAMPSTNNFVATKLRPSWVHTRPKSANRMKEEQYSNRQGYTLQRSSNKPNERSMTKRPNNCVKKTTPENSKISRPVITVPVSQKSYSLRLSAKKLLYLPDQETINRHEDMESQLSEISANLPLCSDRYEESLSSRSDKLMQLKISWQDKIVMFDRMKNDLRDRQNTILGIYANLRETHKEMSTMGEPVELPPADDLRIMNVAKMTPEQLLHLCAGDDVASKREQLRWEDTTPLTIDVNKFYEIPTKLVATCEETLAKRKQLIDWFEALIAEEKGISVHRLSKKINEFNVENDTLKSCLDKAKGEFQKQLEEVMSLMRKGINETMALQLRAEELTYELSELNSQNADLKKHIHTSDNIRSQTNKTRIEELEKELKEEKCKRLLMRDRLSRSDGQVKINVERVTQLEATLEQARSQIWNLERTVQQLHEQNDKLQSDFEKELNKLTESIKEHTVHLEEIAEAREKLQSEKEDLEKRIEELSVSYKESIDNMKLTLNSNIAKLVESEEKYKEQEEEKKILEGKLETLCTQLYEAELCHQTTLQQLHEKETQQENEIELKLELESTKSELEKANLEINDNRELLTKQNEAIKEIERSFKEAIDSGEILKSDLSAKNEYISGLEKKQSLLEEQLQENENKMEAYVEQLSSLKTHIHQLQDQFGDFENAKNVQETVNQLRAKLLELTRQNGELAEALQMKEKELEQFNDTLSEHEQLLIEREGVIKMLSEKEEEQNNIIKIVKNNLELRSRADKDLAQQVIDKNTEIDTLIINLETRKQQISNMEKIILTLEDQTKKASLQRKKDQDYIVMLQNKISECEAFNMDAMRNLDTPKKLDSLIKILENELEPTADHELNSKGHTSTKRKYSRDRKREKVDYHEDAQSRYQSELEAYPTKIVMGNFVKKTYIASNDDQYMGDNLDRKKAITNIDAQKWNVAPETYLNHPYAPKENLTNICRLIPSPPQNSLFTRNVQYLNPEQQRDDTRQFKMFKLAGHRL